MAENVAKNEIPDSNFVVYRIEALVFVHVSSRSQFPSLSFFFEIINVYVYQINKFKRYNCNVTFEFVYSIYTDIIQINFIL